MQLENKVVVVTGAGTGIGASLSRRLLDTGARVVLAGRRVDPLASVLESSDHPENGLAVPTDVTEHEQLRDMVSATVQHFGQIDAVVSNAGIILGGEITEITPEEVEHIVKVNLIAPMWLAQLALPILSRQTESLFVQVSSLSGLTPLPFQAAYAATKFGLRGFGRGLRRDLMGSTTRVLNIYPGGVDTEMTHEMFEKGRQLGTMRSRGMHPSHAAEKIIKAMRNESTEVIVSGRVERALAALDRWTPGIVDLGVRKLRPALREMFKSGTEATRRRYS